MRLQHLPHHLADALEGLSLPSNLLRHHLSSHSPQSRRRHRLSLQLRPHSSSVRLRSSRTATETGSVPEENLLIIQRPLSLLSLLSHASFRSGACFRIQALPTSVFSLHGNLRSSSRMQQLPLTCLSSHIAPGAISVIRKLPSFRETAPMFRPLSLPFTSIWGLRTLSQCPLSICATNHVITDSSTSLLAFTVFFFHVLDGDSNPSLPRGSPALCARATVLRCSVSPIRSLSFTILGLSKFSLKYFLPNNTTVVHLYIFIALLTFSHTMRVLTGFTFCSLLDQTSFCQLICILQFLCLIPLSTAIVCIVIVLPVYAA